MSITSSRLRRVRHGATTGALALTGALAFNLSFAVTGGQLPAAQAQTATQEAGTAVQVRRVEAEQGRSTGTLGFPDQYGNWMPVGGTYELGDEAPSWVSQSGDSGYLTYEPGIDVEPGDYDIPITIILTNGTEVPTVIPVTVTPSTNPLDELLASGSSLGSSLF